MNPKSTALNIFAIIAALFLTIGQAAAEFKEDYSSTAFDTAQKSGKHIVVEVFKQGCGTCAAQQPALKEARKQYPNAVFLAFDFASNLDAVRKFRVVKQSTIIVFKGDDEVARLIGETNQDKILGAIGKGV